MSEEIIINLENLNSTKSLKNNEYIHYQKLVDLTEFILDTVEQNTKEVDDTEKDECSRKCKDAWDDHPVHINQNPCFFIHGRRGSGKSIFLRGLRKMLIVDNERSCKIKLLANVDPTIFAEGENFFIYILSRITKILGDCSHQLFCVQDDDAKRIKEARQLLHQMSKGLQLLSDPKGTLNCSGDADFFFEDSIQNSASGDMLKRNFHKLLSIICKLKCAKALLLTIDDVDLNFNKCSEILETTRKYMFSPHMIIVFAGDLSLYSHAVRGLYLNQFNIRNLDYDDARKQHRVDLLDQLENQYVTKFTPIEHRVELTGIDVKLFYNNNKSITLKYKDEEYRLIDYLRYYLNFIYPENAYYDVYNLLLDQPIRTLFQLVKHWIQFIPYVATNSESQSDRQHKTYDYLAEGLGRAFSQSLIKHHIDFSELHKSNSNELLKEILIHIGKLGILPGSSQLIPTVGDTSDKEVTLFLNAEAVRYISSYYHFMYYMLFIYTMLQYMKSMPDFKYTADSENEFRNKVSTLYYTASDLDNHIPCPWHTAFIIRAVEETSKMKFTHWPGIVRIMNANGDNGREHQKFFEFIKLVEKSRAVKSKPLIHQFVHALYHCICVVTTPLGTAYYFSIYSLLGIMADYLYKVHEVNPPEDIKYNTKEIFQIQSPFSGFRMLDIYDHEHTEEAYIEEEAISEHYSKLSDNLKEYDDHLYNEIIEWAKKYHTINSPCYIPAIDKAWNRFVESSEIHYNNFKRTNAPIGIGSLFLTYIREFTNAFKSDIDSQKGINSEEFISSFPLWKILLEVEKTKPTEEEKSTEEKKSSKERTSSKERKSTKGMKVLRKFIDKLNEIHVEIVHETNGNIVEVSSNASTPQNEGANTSRLDSMSVKPAKAAPAKAGAKSTKGAKPAAKPTSAKPVTESAKGAGAVE